MSGLEKDLQYFFYLSEVQLLQRASLLLSPVAAALVARYKRYSEFYWALGVFFFPLLASVTASSLLPYSLRSWHSIVNGFFMLGAGPLCVLALAFVPKRSAAAPLPARSLFYSLLAFGLIVVALLFFTFLNFPRQH
ncbi:MAG: hypothetical protein PHV33_08635 [Elusimicrobiales bacterium]|nr:hypothetical protein [Elusimicrobiales bacterium]